MTGRNLQLRIVSLCRKNFRFDLLKVHRFGSSDGRQGRVNTWQPTGTNSSRRVIAPGFAAGIAPAHARMDKKFPDTSRG